MAYLSTALHIASVVSYITFQLSSVNIHELIVLPIRHIAHDRLLSHPRPLFIYPSLSFTLLRIPIPLLHRTIHNHPLLPIAHPPPRLPPIQHNQIPQLQPRNHHLGDKDTQHRPQSRPIRRRIARIEQVRPDDIARRAGGAVQAHDDALLRGAGRVGDDPGHDQRVAREQEGEEVVSRQVGGDVGVVSGEGVQDGESRDDGEHEGGEDEGFELAFLGEEGAGEDGEELEGAEGDVEEGGEVFVEADAGQEERAEDIGDLGADVEEEGQGDEKDGLGAVEEAGFEDVGGAEGPVRD